MILMLVTTVVSILVIIIIPKRITTIEMYATSLFAGLLAMLADTYLDLKYDLYGFFEKGVDWGYIPILFFVYPAANILFLNFYPFKKKRKNKFIYISIWTLLTTGFEYVALHTSLFYHHEWRLWYSFFCYPVLYSTMIIHLKIVRRLLKNMQNNRKW